MSSNTFISVWVRDGIKTLMELAATRELPVSIAETLVSIRKRFPELDISDKELTSGIMGEAVAAGAVVVGNKPLTAFSTLDASISAVQTEALQQRTLLDRLVANHRRN